MTRLKGAVAETLLSHSKSLRRGGPAHGALLLHLQQGSFAFDTPAVSPHFAVFPNHAMARNGNCNPVRGTGASHRPGRFRLTDCLGYLSIGLRGSKRQRLQVNPDPFLERRRLNIEGQRAIELVARDLSQYGLGPRAHCLVIALTNGEWEFALQAFDQFLVTIPELNCADAFLGRRHQHASKRRIRAGVANVRCNRPSPILVRRHAQLRRGAFVQAAARTIPGVVKRMGHAPSRLQVAFQQSHAARICVSPRRDSECLLEGPLQMKGTLTEGFRQLFQRDGFVEVLLDVAAHLLHGRSLRISRHRLGLAAQASTEAGFFGFIRMAEESYVLAPRALGRAGRAAVHSGGRNREEELAVVVGVSSQNCVPPLVLRVARPRRHIGLALQVEYRIHGRHERSLGPHPNDSYPKLAVKPSFLQDQSAAFSCQSSANATPWWRLTTND